MRTASTSKLVLLVAASALASCAEPETGGVTAQLVFDTTPGGSSSGSLRQGLRLAAPPPEIFRLEISVATEDGTVLAQTILSKRPNLVAGEIPLNPMGGRWVLDRVRVGTNRVLTARGYFAEVGDPTLSNIIAF